MNPTDFAVVIGIDGYAGLRPLKAAKRDATRFSEWLIDPGGGGLPPENVRLIRSNITPGEPFSARPILQDIEEALWSIGVQQYTRLGRRLYFYFAGHGVGPAFNEVAMLLATAAMGRLTNIGLTQVQRFFHDAAVFDEVVYILDCCREEQSAICTGLSFMPPARPDRPATNDFALLGSRRCGARPARSTPRDASPATPSAPMCSAAWRSSRTSPRSCSRPIRQSLRTPRSSSGRSRPARPATTP